MSIEIIAVISMAGGSLVYETFNKKSFFGSLSLIGNKVANKRRVLTDGVIKRLMGFVWLDKKYGAFIAQLLFCLPAEIDQSTGASA